MKRRLFSFSSRCMRAVDEWVGIPICLILVAWHAISFPLRRLVLAVRGDNHSPVIAMMKFLGMGSIILCAPAAKHLRRQMPDSRIVFVTFESNRRIVELLGIADVILTVRTKGFHIFAFDTIRAILALRRLNVRMTIDCEFFSKYSVVVAYLSGAQVRVGFFLREVWRRCLLTRHAFYNHFKHAQENFGMLLRALSLEFSPERAVVVPSDDGLRSELTALRHRPLVFAVNVNASDVIKLEMRRWSDENFLDLCERLLQGFDCELWFVGAQVEQDYVAGIVSRLLPVAGTADRIVDFSGKTDIDHLAALLASADLVITNDSGIMHLAAAVGSHVCAIFGAETPVVYAPLGDGHLVFSQMSLYCHPCLHVYNRKENVCINPSRYACLNLTKPVVVFDAISHHLTAGPRPDL